MEEKRLYYLFAILLAIGIYLGMENYQKLQMIQSSNESLTAFQQLTTKESTNTKRNIVSLLNEYTQEELIGLSTQLKDRGTNQIINGYAIKQWMDVLSVEVLEHTVNEAGNQVQIRVIVETLVVDKEMPLPVADQIKLAYTYDLSVPNLEKPQHYRLSPAREFDWLPETTQNTTWIKQLPYDTKVEETIKEKIILEVSEWVEEGQEKWCEDKDYTYLNPYKDNMLTIQVEDCQVSYTNESTKNKPAFNVLLKTKVLRKDYKTVYYNYTYQIGMIDKEIVWIDFLNTHEIDK